ncbi:MAG: recombinase family protein [Bdellovibrionaceae bacterium]|nr:recombinase family protein [Pseudobdellovibrionaceae bacterium]
MSNSRPSAVCYVRSDEWRDLREMQIAAIHTYARENHISHLETFEDVNDDGAPSLCTALTFAKQRRVDFFILWRLDRAGECGRSIEKVVEMASDLCASEVRFVCLQDHLDSEQSAKVFLRFLVQAVAHAARLIKGERVSHALKTARALGEPVGRPSSRDDEQILELRRQGHSLREIALQTGVSIWAVQRAIKRWADAQDEGPNAAR